MTMMGYKSYEAVVEYDEAADIFHGEVINMRNVITFQGKSVSELKRAFAASVEDYLAFCKQRGEEPEKPFVRSVRGPHRAGVAQSDVLGCQTRRIEPQSMGDRRAGTRGVAAVTKAMPHRSHAQGIRGNETAG